MFINRSATSRRTDAASIGSPRRAGGHRRRSAATVIVGLASCGVALSGTGLVDANSKADVHDRDAVGAAEAERTDVALIAKTFDWPEDATADHMKQQVAFGDLVGTVSAKYGEVFAGASFAERPGAVSQLMVKGRAPRGVVNLVERSGLKVEIVDGMKFSEREQNERVAQLTKILGEQHREISTAVLPTGEIQIAVAGELKIDDELPEGLVEGVKIVEGPERLTNDEALEGGVQVYATGGGQCTSGFSVRSIFTGTEGISTAAHCFGINRFSQAGPDPVLVHAGEHNGAFGDMEWKTSAEDAVDNYWAGPGDYRDVGSVWGAGSFATNMVTCVHSRMQAQRSCDQIYSTSVSSTVNGITASNLVATDNDNTVGGDSGGPWSYGSIADGIHKGDKWIWFGTRNVFSKADLLPAALGVAVMTTP